MKKNGLFLVFALTVFACKKESITTIVSGPTTIVDKRGAGQSAREFLSAENYTTLNIEIQHAPGMRPQDASINNLVNFLNTYTNKPAGITVSIQQVASIGKPTVSTQDVATFTDANRKSYTDGKQLSLYIYFADAEFTQNTVIGVAFRNTAMFILQKTIQANSGGINQASRVKVESGVLQHEAGHLLGLVNNGSPMAVAHEDGDKKAHCNNNNCLMYFSIQTSGLMNMLSNGIPTLDANCVNDLRMNGGK